MIDGSRSDGYSVFLRSENLRTRTWWRRGYIVGDVHGDGFCDVKKFENPCAAVDSVFCRFSSGDLQRFCRHHDAGCQKRRHGDLLQEEPV